MYRTLLGICLVGMMVAWAGPAVADEIVGWRGNATGLYPGVAPTLEWSTTKNVIWHTPLPDWSNATPVVVGDRIFVCKEPTTLVCLSSADGKILWERANTYVDALPPAEAEAARKKIAEVELDKTLADLKSVQGKLARVEQAAKRAEVALKQAQQKNQDTATAAADVEDKKKALAAAKAEFDPQIATLNEKLKPVRQFIPPETHDVNGFSSATPVSDGKRVWVLFATGMAACYDLDGNRIWAATVGRPTDAWGQSASPVLADGKLVTIVQDVVGLDAATGKEAWRVTAKPHWGSPVVTTVGKTVLVITPNGDAIRASDGKKMAERMPALTYCAPIIDGDVAYFIENGGGAVRLSMEGDDNLKAERLWLTTPKKERYYASPVLLDGVIYCIIQSGVMSAIDAATGAVIWEENLKLGRGTCYPSIVLAGKRLLVSSDNGTTVIVEPGRTYKEVGRNTLEPFRSTPVFAGNRMYVRTLKGLYCFGS